MRKIIAVGSINIIPHCRPAFLNRRLKLYQVRTKYFRCSKLVEERVETPVGVRQPGAAAARCHFCFPFYPTNMNENRPNI